MPWYRKPGPLAGFAVGVVGLVAAVVLVGQSGGDDSTPATSPPTSLSAPTTSALPSTSVAGQAAGEVLLEPVAVRQPDPFTDSVSSAEEAAPAVSLPSIPLPTTSAPPTGDEVAIPKVAGNQPGLYGGTRDQASCDTGQLVAFLENDPERAAAWAGVQGIDPSEIRSFVAGLTPVVLTRDTRVTNHGYRDGQAVPHQSVLQAGHAVLVDEYGVPRVKCSCGNPLAPLVPTSTAPTYTGSGWSGFAPTTLVVVVDGDPVSEGFVLVDLQTGELIVRPVGAGEGVTDLTGVYDVCDVFPDDPACVEAPGPDPVTLLDVGNILAVESGSASAPSFTVDAPTLITEIRTYHYHYGAGTTAPGQLGLQGSDGAFYGPFPATGSLGQGDVPNAYWTATPGIVIPAGTWTVWDSDPATWSHNADSGNVGFATVMGEVGVDLPVDDPTDPPGVGPGGTDGGGAASAADAAVTILDLLLLDCGYVVDLWTDNGPTADGWSWIAVLPEGSAQYTVHDPLGDWWVEPNDQLAADIAVECGFYQP